MVVCGEVGVDCRGSGIFVFGILGFLCDFYRCWILYVDAFVVRVLGGSLSAGFAGW